MANQVSFARIFVIHEDVTLRATLLSVLANARFAAYAFENFQQAIAAPRSLCPDLLVAQTPSHRDLFVSECKRVFADSQKTLHPAVLFLEENRCPSERSELPVRLGASISIYPPFEPRQILMAVQFSLHVNEIREDSTGFLNPSSVLIPVDPARPHLVRTS